MEELLNLPAVCDIHKVSKIRQLYDSIETRIRSLINLGIDSSSYGSLLVPLILSKISEEMRLIVARNIEKIEWNIDKLLCTFKLELEARERCNTLSESSSLKSFENKVRHKGKLPYSSSTLFSGKAPPSVPYCSYCSKQHTSASCPNVTDIAARRAILRKKGKCFLCLKSGHIIKHCDSQRRCQKCGGHHHVSICEKNASKPPTLGSKLGQQQNPVSNQQENQPKSETKSEAAQGTQTEASIMYVESITVVLLQTAQSLVGKVGSVMDQKHKTRIVFDSCSQRSYISNRMRNTLNVETVESENLLVKTFGDKASKVLAYDKVQVAVRHSAMEGYSVPTICSPISNQSIKVAPEEYQHLCGLNLADSSTLSGDNDVEVDILIGADYYWNL